MTICYRAPPELEVKPSASVLSLSRREVSLVTIAGIGWMFVNGAYLVVLSFGPVFLAERGTGFETASLVVSLMSWIFMLCLPLGGYLATRFRMPNLVMFSGLTGTVIVGALIPYSHLPFLTFLLFGGLYALSVPVVAALPAGVLRPENRGPGLGLYFVWYFAGSAFLPVVGGYLRDLSGTAESSLLFGAAMMLATLLLVGVFRFAQGRSPAPAAS